jgi:hypothetical protein
VGDAVRVRYVGHHAGRDEGLLRLVVVVALLVLRAIELAQRAEEPHLVALDRAADAAADVQRASESRPFCVSPPAISSSLRLLNSSFGPVNSPPAVPEKTLPPSRGTMLDLHAAGGRFRRSGKRFDDQLLDVCTL